jgi:hypothetical protein
MALTGLLREPERMEPQAEGSDAYPAVGAAPEHVEVFARRLGCGTLGAE